MINSCVYSRNDGTTNSSEAGNADHAIHAVLIVVVDGQWPATVTLYRQRRTFQLFFKRTTNTVGLRKLDAITWQVSFPTSPAQICHSSMIPWSTFVSTPKLLLHFLWGTRLMVTFIRSLVPLSSSKKKFKLKVRVTDKILINVSAHPSLPTPSQLRLLCLEYRHPVRNMANNWVLSTRWTPPSFPFWQVQCRYTRRATDSSDALSFRWFEILAALRRRLFFEGSSHPIVPNARCSCEGKSDSSLVILDKWSIFHIDLYQSKL